MEKCYAYLRTSSNSNIAGDSRPRQLDAITKYASDMKYEIVETFWDAAVSGDDDIGDRDLLRIYIGDLGYVFYI